MIELFGNLTALRYIRPLRSHPSPQRKIPCTPGASGLAALAIRESLLFSLTQSKMLAAMGDPRGRHRRQPQRHPVGAR